MQIKNTTFYGTFVFLFCSKDKIWLKLHKNAQKSAKYLLKNKLFCAKGKNLYGY